MQKSLTHLFIGFTCAVCSYATASTVTINDAAYGLSYYINPAATAARETHVVGIYESRSDHGGGYHPQGTATVHVSGTASVPINLVLSSYEPTKWVLEGDGISYISAIVVNGYHQSEVIGVSPSIVIDKNGYPGEYWSACARQWPSSTGGCDTQSLVTQVESYFGSSITSFSGAYRATEFTINLTPVPEPETYALFGTGILMVGLATRRKK